MDWALPNPTTGRLREPIGYKQCDMERKKLYVACVTLTMNPVTLRYDDETLLMIIVT